MSSRVGEGSIVAAGLAYLLLLGWAVANISYDVWGALIVVPVYALLGIAGLRLMFRGSLEPIATVMYWGLLVKLGGAFARYWVGFEAYGGGIDAVSYHQYANEQAGAVWSGDKSIIDIVPYGHGTAFVERFTAFVYTFTGASQLAGFVTFALLGYVGIAFFVKAAAVAIPGLAQRKYAWMCVLFPSLVYWPSSIGKEAVVMLGLGVGSYGIAIMLARRQWFTGMFLVAIGLGFTALIRPHMSGIWVAAAVPALALAVVLGSRAQTLRGSQKRMSRAGLLVMLVVAAVGLSAIGAVTVRFFNPDNEEAGRSLTEILNETTRLTQKSGSTFEPPSFDNPANWPYATVRTLTRPLPTEVRGAAQLLSAAELVALYGIAAASWKRVRNLPMLLLTNPYVVFSIMAMILSALAFSSFANLGILTRQKSLLMPFLLLVPCLPINARRRHGNGESRRAPRSTSTPTAAMSERKSVGSVT